MRIGFDARILSGTQPTGIGRYAYHLLSALGRFGEGNRFSLFFPGRAATGGVPRGPFERRGSPVPAGLREDRFYRLWLDCYLPWQILRRRLDLFHGPSYLIPRTKRARTVVTVHDLTHEKYPNWALSCSAEFAARARRSALEADAIIAVSGATREDILEVYGVEERKVRVIYEGVEACFRPVGDRALLDERRARYRLPERFVFSVISVHPRKNLEGLLRAFALLARETALPHALVVAGKEYGGEGLPRTVRSLGIGDRFIFLRYVPWEELPLLYNLAELFVFPSRYEGFGLPAVEAMASGTPVAASRAGSLPEVCGDAAVYFDPENPAEMAERIAGLLSSEEERELLRARGLARAAQFSWDGCARRTMELYRELVRA